MKRPAHERCLPLYPVGAHVSAFIDGVGELPCTVLQVRKRRKFAKHYLVKIHVDDRHFMKGWLRRTDLAPGWPT